MKIVLIIGIILGIILLLVGKYILEENTCIGLILIIVGAVVLLGSATTNLVITQKQADQKKEQLSEKLEAIQAERDAVEKLAEDMIKNGANVYLDGQLIDGDKIILDYYDITVVDDYIILNKL